MLKIVLLQISAAFLSSIIGLIAFGWHGAASALLGGATIVIPNCLFVCYLKKAAKLQGVQKALNFLVGQALKIGLILCCIAVVKFAYVDVLWGAVVMGLLITIQANFFAFLMKI